MQNHPSILAFVSFPPSPSPPPPPFLWSGAIAQGHRNVSQGFAKKKKSEKHQQQQQGIVNGNVVKKINLQDAPYNP